MSERARLDSWKEIAQHLGRDARTVIRWEQSQGLPVHRVAGGRITRVFAYTDELDAWLRGHPAEEQPPAPPAATDSSVPRTRARLAGAVVMFAAVAAIGAAWFAAAGTRAQRVMLEGNDLLGLDSAGRRAWTYRLAGEAHRPLVPWNYVGDLDGDGQNDIVTAVEVVRPPLSVPTVTLSRFSDSGALIWSQGVDDDFRFRAGQYGPPWAASNVTVYRTRGQERIAWAVHHYTWWPSLLLTLDHRGGRVSTFVNSGWIHDVRATMDERYLLISGVTNSHRAYFYAVLDAANPSGRSPEPAGSETECLTCPRGVPIAYVVFPRTDVGMQYQFPSTGPTIQTFDDGRVQVQVIERSGTNAASIIFELRSPTEIAGVRFSDAFWEAHRGLEAMGKLHHKHSACPERGGLTVAAWSPGSQWKTSRVRIVGSDAK